MAYNETFTYLSALYKSRLLNMFSTSDDLFFIISPTPVQGFDNDQILLGGEFIIKGNKTVLQPYLYDFQFVPTTLTEAKLIVCVEIDSTSVENSMMSNFVFNVYIFSPRTSIPLNEYTIPKKSEVNQHGLIGNRIDCTCQIIEHLMKGSESFGLGKITVAARDFTAPFSPDDAYAGKRMKFKVNGFSPLEVVTCGN